MEQAGLKQILREKEDLERWSLEPMEQGREKETSRWALTMLCCGQQAVRVISTPLPTLV